MRLRKCALRARTLPVAPLRRKGRGSETTTVLKRQEALPPASSTCSREVNGGPAQPDRVTNYTASVHTCASEGPQLESQCRVGGKT